MGLIFDSVKEHGGSEMKSVVQAHGYRFGDIPNVHQLRSDVWRMLAVARPAQVVARLPVAAAPGGRAPPPPEPALPWGFRKTWLNGHSTEKTGLTKHPGTTGDSGGSDDQEHRQPTQQRSSLQQARDHLGNTGAYGFPEDFPLHEAGPSSVPRRCWRETDGVDDEQESILSDEEAEVDATRPQDADGQHEEWMLPSWPPRPGMEPRPDPTAPGVWLVPYCMCVELSGENCTVHNNKAGDDIIMMCNDCIHALECVDGDCGMAYPRHIRCEFKWVGDSGLFVLPRYGPNIVPHCPAVTMVLGCNNVFMLACELDRQYTATVEKQLVLPVPMCDPEVLEDILVQTEVVARRTMHYATKYVAKATSQCPHSTKNPLNVHTLDDQGRETVLRVRCHNVPLRDAYAVTDFFVQGCSFKDDCWIVDLCPPPTGIKCACLFVILMRYKSMDHIRLLHPLYNNAYEKAQVIKAFTKAATIHPDLDAESKLQTAAAQRTRERYTALFQEAQRLVDSRTANRPPPR
ncbi:hypothetical protein VOLCADRAFT_98895 [Volvox carteri f. nagariensis]|uniref:Uncharacterized protein n=1 Tax=Volvox carteri f. nagariensis TaxID=3068 RepID=D8UGJ4_VOLCA|nr:uncharacterized protein VOLCADRAFT_98895 [Volvox carteri f. nagariensis]EFJ41108.1 hypothetical protein VOLCADRAFT_98895 [Volvox carteri f. nagariensis]|eukprot:XP_002957780.1 hypothetical protein VOLCADRAFT_98895 [Volvox carteri f. nagariensis]